MFIGCLILAFKPPPAVTSGQVFCSSLQRSRKERVISLLKKFTGILRLPMLPLATAGAADMQGGAGRVGRGSLQPPACLLWHLCTKPHLHRPRAPRPPLHPWPRSPVLLGTPHSPSSPQLVLCSGAQEGETSDFSYLLHSDPQHPQGCRRCPCLSRHQSHRAICSGLLVPTLLMYSCQLTHGRHR